MTAKIKEEIKSISNGLFQADQVESFISKFEILLGAEKLIDCLIQVSTDEGNELEIGFFTDTRIADVTLSKGTVYFYAYPVSAIKTIDLVDSDLKWTLSITGEKKFDYNVVKPGDDGLLDKYRKSLQAHKPLHSRE